MPDFQPGKVYTARVRPLTISHRFVPLLIVSRTKCGPDRKASGTHDAGHGHPVVPVYDLAARLRATRLVAYRRSKGRPDMKRP